MGSSSHTRMLEKTFSSMIKSRKNGPNGVIPWQRSRIDISPLTSDLNSTANMCMLSCSLNSYSSSAIIHWSMSRCARALQCWAQQVHVLPMTQELFTNCWVHHPLCHTRCSPILCVIHAAHPFFVSYTLLTHSLCYTHCSPFFMPYTMHTHSLCHTRCSPILCAIHAAHPFFVPYMLLTHSLCHTCCSPILCAIHAAHPFFLSYTLLTHYFCHTRCSPILCVSILPKQCMSLPPYFPSNLCHSHHTSQAMYVIPTILPKQCMSLPPYFPSNVCRSHNNFQAMYATSTILPKQCMSLPPYFPSNACHSHHTSQAMYVTSAILPKQYMSLPPYFPSNVCHFQHASQAMLFLDILSFSFFSKSLIPRFCYIPHYLCSYSVTNTPLCTSYSLLSAPLFFHKYTSPHLSFYIPQR